MNHIRVEGGNDPQRLKGLVVVFAAMEGLMDSHGQGKAQVDLPFPEAIDVLH